jgi:3-dehydroquinate synthase II
MSLDRIVLWPNAAEAADRADLTERARRRGFRRFVGAGAPADGPESWYRPEPEAFVAAGEERPPRLRRLTIRSPEELERLSRLAREESVAIRWIGERVLPLETWIAQRSHERTLWVEADRPEEIPAALGALEHGADAVVVGVAVPADLDRIESFTERLPGGPLEWAEVPLARIVPAGMADRVLVDTTSLLGPDEGLLTGSSAAFLFHVRSEALGSRYTRPRPFRVNAGGPHAYVLLADGTTRYLSELEPGDAVLAVGPRAPGRSVRVGRLKIERRPMVLLEARDHGVARTVFLQEAETVALTGPEGARPVTSLSAGVALLGVRAPSGRHLGHAVTETVEER